MTCTPWNAALTCLQNQNGEEKRDFIPNKLFLRIFSVKSSLANVIGCIAYNLLHMSRDASFRGESVAVLVSGLVKKTIQKKGLVWKAPEERENGAESRPL
jgi:hypothetical protein